MSINLLEFLYKKTLTEKDVYTILNLIIMIESLKVKHSIFTKNPRVISKKNEKYYEEIYVLL